MEHLSNAIPVWPPVREQSDAVRKCRLTENLDKIARHSKHPRPRSHPLTAQKPSATELETRNWVLKRERSCCAEHVKLPTDTKSLTGKIRQELLQSRYIWLAQEYMPLLRRIGEWRVVVVGGRVEHVVFTHPDDAGQTTFVVVDHYKTLGVMG